MTQTREFSTPQELKAALGEQQYIANDEISTILYLAQQLQKPLLTEGPAGVGKTELAKAIACATGRELIRLQCYEGLDVHNAVYEWAYARQILHLRVLDASGATREEMERDIYSREFLLARPLLQAIEDNAERVPVLLIDEVDRADEEFESFLLEVLSDFQISVPEIGTIRAARPPVVVITSNRTREVHDALKRRCLYHWIDYPDFETEYEIVSLKVPGIAQRLSYQVVAAVQTLRQVDLFKPPGVAETLDWATALMIMDERELSEETISDTLGVLLKYQDDVQRVQAELVHELARRAHAARG